jgi:hypothetical protein
MRLAYGSAVALGAWAALGLLIALGRGAAAADGWQQVDPDRFPIVSKFAPLSERPVALGERNKLSGKQIKVRFSYEDSAFALVVYNESPMKLVEPSMAAATQQALSTTALFKDGAFSPGDVGSADSPLGPFTYQLVHAQQPVADQPLLSCAVFQRLLSAGMAAVTGFFCGQSDGFNGEEVRTFFATLGIRGIAMP